MILFMDQFGSTLFGESEEGYFDCIEITGDKGNTSDKN